MENKRIKDLMERVGYKSDGDNYTANYDGRTINLNFKDGVMQLGWDVVIAIAVVAGFRELPIFYGDAKQAFAYIEDIIKGGSVNEVEVEDGYEEFLEYVGAPGGEN